MLVQLDGAGRNFQTHAAINQKIKDMRSRQKGDVEESAKYNRREATLPKQGADFSSGLVLCCRCP